MQLEQRRQAMLQLHLSDQQAYYQLRWDFSPALLQACLICITKFCEISQNVKYQIYMGHF